MYHGNVSASMFTPSKRADWIQSALSSDAARGSAGWEGSVSAGCGFYYPSQQLGRYLDAPEVAALVRRVDVGEGGAYRNHVELRVFLGEGPALHAGVDGLDDHIPAREELVLLAGDAREGAVRVHGPAGHVALALQLKAEGPRQGFADDAGLLGAVAARAACEEGEAHALLPYRDYAEVGGALHEAVYEGAHGKHVVGHGGHQADEAVAAVLGEDALGRSGERGGEDAARLDVAERARKLGLEGLKQLHRPLGVGHGQRDDRAGARRDGVLGLAALKGREAEAHAVLPQILERRRGGDEGVGVAEVYAHARVAAEEAGQAQLYGHGALRRALPAAVAVKVEIVTTGAGVAERAERLPVEVYQIAALEVLRREADAGHAVLLVHREDGAQRAVLQVGVLEHAQRHGDADAVVRSQAGALGSERIALADRLDAVRQRVEFDALGGDADHVHVRLHYEPRHVFAAGRGGLVDYDLAQLVALGVQPAADGPVEQVFAYPLLVVGGARDLRHGQEFAQHGLAELHFGHMLTSLPGRRGGLLYRHVALTDEGGLLKQLVEYEVGDEGDYDAVQRGAEDGNHGYGLEYRYAAAERPGDYAGPVHAAARGPVLLLSLAEHPVVADDYAHDGRHDRAEDGDVGVERVGEAHDGEYDAQDADGHGHLRAVLVLH